MITKNYDSGFCGSLPLAFINQIQSYGFLIVTDLNLKIIQVSDNISQFVKTEIDSIIDQLFPDLLQEDVLVSFNEKLSLNESKGYVSIRLRNPTNSNTNFLAIIHKKTDHYIFEVETAGERQNNFFEVYELVRSASAAIEKTNNFEDTLEVAARELKRISGFDKVMIYKFDENWNGHVLAEAKERDMVSYLNLHFPASDIPKQARELYLKNPYRQIPDKDYIPAKLYPVINPIVSGFLDLSSCNMRAVPKVHIEYLSNMKVVASMSTRILKDNQLWGLISCHHRTKKFLTYQESSVFELLSGIISSKLSAMEVKEDLNYNYEQQKVISTIMENIFSEATLNKGLRKTSDTVLQLLKCDGFIYSDSETISQFGSCPDEESIERLLVWLQTRSLTQVFNTSRLIDHFDEADQMSEKASGIIVMPVISDNREFVVAFRKEVPQKINWGGNPEEAIQFEADKNTYHPRNSFNLWQEQIRTTSLPFIKNEIFFANELQRIILGFRVSQNSKT